jgi:hypothetical protein
VIDGLLVALIGEASPSNDHRADPTLDEALRPFDRIADAIDTI